MDESPPPEEPVRTHLRNGAGCLAAIVGVVFLIGVIVAWNKGIGFLLLLLAIVAIPVVLLLSGAILSFRGVRLAIATQMPIGRKVLLSAATPVMLIIAVTVAWPALAGGNFFGTAMRLFANQSLYEAIIETERRAASSRSTGYRTFNGVTYAVDHGPPLRVAFNPEGMLDNWSGIIFDPTHQVMLADGMDRDGRFRAPPHVTELFGGDLVSCRHLWGDYFHCGFT